MVIIRFEYINQKVQERFAQLICQKSSLYQKGKLATSQEEQVKILAFIKKFSHRWDNTFLKQIDCYLDGRHTN